MSLPFAITIRPRGGMTDDMVASVLDFFKACPYLYAMEMEGSDRHMHMGTFFKRNPGLELHRKLVKQWPNAFELKSVAIKIKTWYKGDLGNGTWIEYLSKDGAPSSNKPEDFNWYELLADDKAIDERRKQVWQQMASWAALFKENDLPFGSVGEVWHGIETLAYVLKLAALPSMQHRSALRVDLYHYMNSSVGSMDSAEQFIENRKRKRVDTQPVVPAPAYRAFLSNLYHCKHPIE